MPQDKIVSMRTLRAERAKASDFQNLKQVADFLGLPEAALHEAVLKAFIDLVNEDKWIQFPLMLQQVPQP